MLIAVRSIPKLNECSANSVMTDPLVGIDAESVGDEGGLGPVELSESTRAGRGLFRGQHSPRCSVPNLRRANATRVSERGRRDPASGHTASVGHRPQNGQMPHPNEALRVPVIPGPRLEPFGSTTASTPHVRLRYTDIPTSSRYIGISPASAAASYAAQTDHLNRGGRAARS